MKMEITQTYFLVWVKQENAELMKIINDLKKERSILMNESKNADQKYTEKSKLKKLYCRN